MGTTLREVSEVAAHLRLVIARSARRLRQEALGAEAGPELSPTLVAALATIETRGPLTPSELATRERIRRPTATRIVSRLVDAGLAARTVDPADRRSALVSITPTGRALLRRLRRRKNEYLAQRLRGLDAEELATLDRAAELLERLLDEEQA